jgi:ABC-type lipoprotein release transport system permease subunit
MLAQVGVPLPGDLEDLYKEFNMPSRLFPKFDWSAVQIAALLMFFGIQAAAFVPGRQIARLRPVDALRHAG